MGDDRWRRVEELYHAAVGLMPERRAAFLKDMSAGDSELRREVESLLVQHDSRDSVFDQPAWMDVSAASEPPAQTVALFASGAVLGPYRIVGLLGAGGMGQVYRAHDSRLHRSVAIKVLYPGQNVRRFETEARAVAALSHPNVVPIFDVGHDGGVDYLVEELVEGESLRELLRHGPLPVATFRHLAAQIAAGLAAAHRAGIVHRDLKPGNIMVSREGCARILDFGLATIQPAGPGDASVFSTGLGAVAGTAAYMSPEQVQGSGIDSRSDIFSYGAVLYEMITGRRAFARDSIPATLKAVLEEEPPPVRKIAPRAPRKLAEIVHKCLNKDPRGRFQAIDDVRLALEDGQEETTLPLWKRPPSAFGVAMAAAAVVIGLAVWGWIQYSRKASGLTSRDSIVLADFRNSTGDSVFDDALKQGLAVQLGQSPLLNILPEQRVRSALKEMTRSPDDALTPKVAQEVCVRTGSKAYIAGSIANLGGNYVIGLNAINCASGDTLAREQTEAAGKQQVIAALGRAAAKLRGKLGESLNSIQEFDVPLAQATTPSLEALQAYTFGLAKFAKGEQAGSVLLFQKAIALDPDFALAYADMGRAYQTLGQSGRMDEALRKAFALRNRTSERERFDISSVYYQFVTLQTDETIQNCELWARTYPLDFTPHRVLGFEYAVLGRLDQSVEEFYKAKELDRNQALPYAGLMFGYMALNRLNDANAIYQEALAHKLRFGGRPSYFLAFLDGDKEMMKASAEPAGLEESITEAYFGRLEHARELFRHAEDAALGEGDKAAAGRIEATIAMLEALFGNSAVARRRAAVAFRLSSGTPMPSVHGGEPGSAKCGPCDRRRCDSSHESGGPSHSRYSARRDCWQGLAPGDSRRHRAQARQSHSSRRTPCARDALRGGLA